MGSDKVDLYRIVGLLEIKVQRKREPSGLFSSVNS